MNIVDSTHYLPAEGYVQAIEILRGYTGIVLLSFAKHSSESREAIIRNFIARGMACLESILQIWRLGNFQDCWILHRSLLDRLFHLRALWDRDEFDIFEKWSFVRQFEDKNCLLSDPEVRKKLKPEVLSFSTREKKRYAQIKQENISWSRPKAEQMAKEMDLLFLYKFGYDYASTHVHPMANDGEEDFLRLTGLSSGSRPGQMVVLHNSFLVQILLTQEGLNASSLRWRAIVYDFLEHCMLLLASGSQEYLKTFAKIASLGSDFEWCQPAPNS